MAHMDTPHPSSLDDLKANTQVLAFDIFGTVVDWHGSIVREMQALYPLVDGNAFALAWRAGYQPAMARVRSGELGWTRIDELHRLVTDDITFDCDDDEIMIIFDPDTYEGALAFSVFDTPEDYRGQAEIPAS